MNPIKEDLSSVLKPAYKLWLETEEGYIFGKGISQLLLKIREVGTISGAAKSLGMSYRHAWGIIKKTEKRIGKPLLTTQKGGKFGGGSARLTPTGLGLMKEFLKFRDIFEEIRKDELSWEGLSLKISARNHLEGEVTSVEKGEVGAKVKIMISVPCIITSFITREAVDDLKIRKGDKAIAVIKATEVMVSKDL